jgi:hypothetical protein
MCVCQKNIQTSKWNIPCCKHLIIPHNKQCMGSVSDELLDSISDLEWLNKVINGSDALLLPLGENGTAVTYRLGINEVH